MNEMRDLTPIECEAMEKLQRGDILLITRIPDKTETDVLGSRTPGLNTFKRLEKLGLVYETLEDLIYPEDGPDSQTWTPTIELTEEGQAWKRPPLAPSPPRPRARRVS